MDNPSPKQQLVERLKSANNVLVTVSANPSVDQLAACIGLTLMLNKQGKHATAVFSGSVPSTLEFLKPEETLEKTTDSLRDFIISLDKSKADKLRYKVEDRIVKIFITPYRTSLSADDLEFSQGDFNVDAVVALGVKEQQDLDTAITGHGRILHDATVATVNTSANGSLGNINWNDTQASSLCELVVDLGRELDKDLLDNQIATALLTGIVAETNRFSNERTTPQTMSVSAELMKAGANQQLVASELQSEAPGQTMAAANAPVADSPQAANDGTLEIGHPDEDKQPELPTVQPDSQDETPANDFKDDGTLDVDRPSNPQSHLVNQHEVPKIITEPPRLGGQLTANTQPEGLDPSVDPLSMQGPEDAPLLTHEAAAPPAPAIPLPEPAPAVMPEPKPAPALEPPAVMQDTSLAPPPWTPPSFASQKVSLPQPPLPPLPVVENQPSVPQPAVEHNETLSQLEQAVESPHLDAVRNEVEMALNEAPSPPAPVQALNAQSIDLTAPDQPEAPPDPAAIQFDPSAFGAVDPGVDTPPTMPLPPSAPAAPPQSEPSPDPSIPPVPPPLPFQFGGPQSK